MSHVLIITHDYIGAEMAGPAIRCWEIAAMLSRQHNVTLASITEPVVNSRLFRTMKITEQSLTTLYQWADIIIIQPTVLWSFPSLSGARQPIVVDLYNVFIVESLEANQNLPPEDRCVSNRVNLSIAEKLLQTGDYFLCANERQKDYWLGMLSYANRLNPDLYTQDPTGNSLIAVVPNGIPSRLPVHRENVVKGVLGSVRPSDKLVIWGGSICNWFDPVTLIQAVTILKRERDDIKLFFMGSKAPNTDVPNYIWSEASKAIKLSKELGLYQKDVIFNPGWVPYEDRESYLLEADLGISLHYNNLETRYSYRTRILDYLWADLPVITSEGDFMAQLVSTHYLGHVVPCQSPRDVAASITHLLEYKEEYLSCKANIAAIRPNLHWENLMLPLLKYCRKPWKKIKSWGE